MFDICAPHTYSETREHRSTALAELAHDSLVDARTATLYVEGVGFVDEDTAPMLTLSEREGRPVLLCPAVDRITHVAVDGCAAVLTVPAREAADGAVQVGFIGRLHWTRTYGEGHEQTAMLELAPASIMVESPSGRAEFVDLARYTSRWRRTQPSHDDDPEALPQSWWAALEGATGPV